MVRGATEHESLAVKLRVSPCWCSRTLALGNHALMGTQELQGLHLQHLKLTQVSPTSRGGIVVLLSEDCSWQTAASPLRPVSLPVLQR